jgi:hypothetical protein
MSCALGGRSAGTGAWLPPTTCGGGGGSRVRPPPRASRVTQSAILAETTSDSAHPAPGRRTAPNHAFALPIGGASSRTITMESESRRFEPVRGVRHIGNVGTSIFTRTANR